MKSVTVGWFEIPVHNMERAMKFYEEVFDCELSRNKMGDLDMAWFPWDENGKGAGGSLVKHVEYYEPSDQGSLIYFSSEDVSMELGRVEEAGGKVLTQKEEIAPDIGFMGIFQDTEGNKIAVHSRQ
ncbi:VOC family protein [Litoribacter populi]|uniref:VOC family protein n=1 Tax=Litoribacter populi TaxID=2598460 RepID=UPI00117E220A|nr:VOC family protein [Litoribacter populi]